ncbi:MAG: metallophosphoesterase family protein [Candidatus Methylacidiphilales bacterium]
MGKHRIGVVADTHNRLPGRVLELLVGVKEIWHLGDVVDEGTLDPLFTLGVALTVIRGNNDFSPWPLTADLKRGELRFHLVHIPPVKSPSCDILIHGHTHVPRDEMVAGVRWLNPGSAGLANKGAPRSVGLLTVDGNRLEWQVLLV